MSSAAKIDKALEDFLKFKYNSGGKAPEELGKRATLEE